MKVRTTITVDWDIPADSDLDEFHADLAEALDLIDLPYQQTARDLYARYIGPPEENP